MRVDRYCTTYVLVLVLRTAARMYLQYSLELLYVSFLLLEG